MCINQKVIDYIKQYSSQGYNISQIRAFLIQNNISPSDVDEAIAFVNSNQNSVQYGQNNFQPSQSNPYELQLRSYIQTQVNNGFNIELIKSTLISRGYDAFTVNRIASEIGNVNINVNHNVHFSSGTIISIFLILLIGGGVFGAYSLGMFSSKDQLLDVSITTNEYSYSPGDSINYQLAITSMGSVKRFDTIVKSVIVDDANNVITRKEETIAVETTTSVNRNIQLPKNTKIGTYKLQIIVDYGKGQLAKSSVEFIIEDETNPIIDNGGLNNNTKPPESTTRPVTPTKPNTNSNVKTFGDVLFDVKNVASNNAQSAVGMCDKLSNVEQKDICYTNIATSSSESYSYCDKVKNIEYRDNCYLSFVIDDGNVEVCNKISDESSKAFCEQLELLKLMDKYYRENNTEKIVELSEKLNPTIYTNNPQVNTYEYVYSEPISIMDIVVDPNEIEEEVSSENSSINSTSDSTI